MKHTQKKRKLGVKLIALAFVLIGALILIDLRIRPIIEKTSSYQSKILATRIINQAVYDEVHSELFDYTALIGTTLKPDGTISSLQTNMINVNKLKTLVTANVNEALQTMEEHKLSISMGTLSGIYFLYGKGPTIPVTVSPQGYVQTMLASEFASAGINQTVHRIVLEISVDISAIIPGYTTSVQVDTNFVVAETVVVGEIPDSYTYIITGNEELIDRTYWQ